jgi:hypothetical protein
MCVQDHVARQVIAAALKKLITVRIFQCHEQLRRLKVTHQHVTASLTAALPPNVFTSLTAQTQRSANLTFQRVRTRQKAKLASLRTPHHTPYHPVNATPITTSENDHPGPIDRWLYNKSSVTLTDPQVRILTKGLAFRPTPAKPPIVDFIAASESAAIAIGTDTAAAADLRSAVAQILSHPKLSPPNITPEESQAICQLQKNHDITQTNKGGATVIMDTTKYYRKMIPHTSGNPTNLILPADPTKEYRDYRTTYHRGKTT